MLYAEPDSALFVVQHSGRRPRTTIGQPGGRIEADPLTGWWSFDVDRDVRVHEHPAIERQRRLVGNDRLHQPDPRERRTGLEPAAAGIAHFAAVSVKRLE